MLKKILENKKLCSDIILVAVLLVISLSVFLIVFLNREAGATVIVSVDGKRVAEYSLAVDGVYYLNGGTNTLVIEDGKAYIRDATCPDKYSSNGCVNTGKISYVGESIVCLPHKLVVEVVGDGEEILR